MKTRSLLTIVAAIAVACGSRAESPGVAPSATASTVTSATTSPSPAATASSTLRPNPTAGPGTYTSVALAFRVDLPEGWRRSACESGSEPQHLPAVEGFTSATIDEEVSSDMGPNNAGVGVRVEDNTAKQTALQWLESGKLGSSIYTKYEQISFDGKPDAARVTYTEGGVSNVTAIVVVARAQIYAISRTGPLTSAVIASQTSLLNSLHILSDVELSDAKATFASAAAVVPSRTVEEAADAMARAFAQKDTAALAPIAWQCVWQGNEQAGAATRPSTVFLSNLQKSFAAGLTVAVQSRPIETMANAPADAQIRGTWKEAGQAQRSARFILSKVGTTYYWRGVVLGP